MLHSYARDSSCRHGIWYQMPLAKLPLKSLANHADTLLIDWSDIDLRFPFVSMLFADSENALLALAWATVANH